MVKQQILKITDILYLETLQSFYTLLTITFQNATNSICEILVDSAVLGQGTWDYGGCTAI